MATQMQLARQGIITEAMQLVAEQEGITAEFVREGVAKGTIAIPCNINHKNLTPRGVGQGLSVKVNANIGTSAAIPTLRRSWKSWLPLSAPEPIQSWIYPLATISVLHGRPSSELPQ